ncbi:flagellar hook-basal body protein [Actomonas aquatica]|uniref:Flagellar hook protein FlgE n=1 Tax=Actomonas aquatica TaxID=2866162 RepID=A0ABZ1CC90_9BACT|nr:flagellar hook-basal body complex protein [Opitutus sp. WL0086]WRQ89275.1 flagellar hook-basal body complex protein [Opitutus sp. WL0086]
MSLIGTLTSGVSAMRSFTKGLEVIGNNISNVNTTGYKASSASFADSFSNTIRGSAPSSGTSSNTSAVQVGTGVRVAGINSRFTQGALTTTGSETDLGISGAGFFVVENPVDGEQFATRAGNFRTDDQGYLVSSQGYRVQGLTGGSAGVAPATLGDVIIGSNPPAGETLKSFSIDKLGNVVEFYSDGSSATTNRILLQNYNDPSALQKQGDNLFNGFAAAGIIGNNPMDGTTNGPGEGGLGSIQSGTLELSNVDLTEEFANMITAQRSFQASSRLVTVSDTVLEDIVNLKR